MASGKQPITRHPLFPATVALWFGALFGIGSLVLPPAMITSLITSSSLDAIISVPISATTRILIALTLAGLGGFWGAWLARRIGKPKPVVTPRKRGAAAPAEASDVASPPLYLNVDEEVAAEARSNKRSQLALPEEHLSPAEPFDHAPLPGNSKIFDVSQFGLKGFDPAVNQDLSRNPTPVLSLDTETPPAPDAPSTPRFNVQPPEDSADSAVEHALFIEAEPATNHDIALPGFSISQGEDDAPSPELSLPRFANSDDEDESSPFTAGNNAFIKQSSSTAPFTQPFSAQVSSIQWNIEAGTDEIEGLKSQAVEKPDAITRVQSNYAQAETSAAERIAHADLGKLSPVELLERLAISLREKRKRAMLATSALEVPTSHDTDIDKDSSALEDKTEDTPSAYSSNALTDNSLNLENEALPENSPVTGDTLQDDKADAGDEEDHSRCTNTAQPAPPVIPAALRPVGLDPADDDEILPCIAPPRFFSANGIESSHLQNRDSYNGASDPAAEGATGALSIPKTGDNETALEAGYNSLRNFSRPELAESQSANSQGHGFVRIEEPESLNEEIQPVVIFPSQLAGVSSPSQNSEQSSSSAHPSQEQAPSADDQTSATHIQGDRDETERTLRSALANVQRISGAA